MIYILLDLKLIGGVWKVFKMAFIKAIQGINGYNLTSTIV
jgi:hypothetical protein